MTDWKRILKDVGGDIVVQNLAVALEGFIENMDIDQSNDIAVLRKFAEILNKIPPSYFTLGGSMIAATLRNHPRIRKNPKLAEALQEFVDHGSEGLARLAMKQKHGEDEGTEAIAQDLLKGYTGNIADSISLSHQCLLESVPTKKVAHLAFLIGKIEAYKKEDGQKDKSERNKLNAPYAVHLDGFAFQLENNVRWYIKNNPDALMKHLKNNFNAKRANPKDLEKLVALLIYSRRADLIPRMRDFADWTLDQHFIGNVWKKVKQPIGVTAVIGGMLTIAATLAVAATVVIAVGLFFYAANSVVMQFVDMDIRALTTDKNNPVTNPFLVYFVHTGVYAFAIRLLLPLLDSAISAVVSVYNTARGKEASSKLLSNYMWWDLSRFLKIGVTMTIVVTAALIMTVFHIALKLPVIFGYWAFLVYVSLALMAELAMRLSPKTHKNLVSPEDDFLPGLSKGGIKLISWGAGIVVLLYFIPGGICFTYYWTFPGGVLHTIDEVLVGDKNAFEYSRQMYEAGQDAWDDDYTPPKRNKRGGKSDPLIKLDDDCKFFFDKYKKGVITKDELPSWCH